MGCKVTKTRKREKSITVSLILMPPQGQDYKTRQTSKRQQCPLLSAIAWDAQTRFGPVRVMKSTENLKKKKSLLLFLVT